MEAIAWGLLFFGIAAALAAFLCIGALVYMRVEERKYLLRKLPTKRERRKPFPPFEREPESQR